MSFLHITDVKMRGVATCVPKNVMDNRYLQGFSEDKIKEIVKATGVERHRISDDNVCSSDLCFHAAEKLISDLKWDREEIDCLVFVSQTPDYTLPATSCLLQKRLGLKEEILALDIPLGCSGWVYGLQVMASLISHGSIKKGLLLVGDTTLKFCSPEDQSTYPIFGDAGSATALEYSKSSPGFKFHSAVDGNGYESIIITDGGFRNRVKQSSLKMVQVKPGIKRNRIHVVLDGMNVLSFSIRKAPESIMKLSNQFSIDLPEIDYFLFHQANRFINERIRNKLKLPPEKVPYSIKEFGNTGPASIPVTMVTQLAGELQKNSLSLLACGFGVGLSWGSVQFQTDRIVCPELVEI